MRPHIDLPGYTRSSRLGSFLIALSCSGAARRLAIELPMGCLLDCHWVAVGLLAGLPLISSGAAGWLTVGLLAGLGLCLFRLGA